MTPTRARGSKHTDRNIALQPGELVKDGHFTLFESVGALEVKFRLCEATVYWSYPNTTY
jgi:hypothetical protein